MVFLINSSTGRAISLRKSARSSRPILISNAASRAANLDYETVYADYAAIGTPEQVVSKLKFFQQIFDPQEFMGWFNIGGMLPNDEVANSMKLFAEKVIPQFR